MALSGAQLPAQDVVLATKIGRQRSFGLGLFLTIVTFGIYAVYWNYRAHNELYRQFELGREGRDEGMVWYVLGLVLPPFLLAYLWVFASNVTYLRERIGLKRAMTPARLVGFVGIGVGAFAVGIILLEAAFIASGPTPTEEDVNAAIDAAGGTFLLLAIAAAVLLAIGYAGLQRDINELWNAFDARITYLSQHPEEMRSPEMAALAQAPGAGTLALPVAREVEALRGKHPNLRALPELDRHLRMAETGDTEARERAEILLADVAALLMERTEILRHIEEREREMAPIRERIAAGTIYETELRDQLAKLEPTHLRERLDVLETALFLRP